MTSLPAPRPRPTLPQISAVAWEHPADRAALQALRTIPGVDEVIRKTLALLGGERGVRLLFQGNAVRIGPAQCPKLWHLHNDVATTFDGAPVSREHGGPARVIIPKLYAWKGAKFIKSITFLEEDKLGFWEVRGYSNTADPWKEERYA